MAEEAADKAKEAELKSMEPVSRKVNFSQEEIDATEELVQTTHFDDTVAL